MKFELKRIEATLDQMNALNAQEISQPEPSLILQAMRTDAAPLPTQTPSNPTSKVPIQPFPVPKSPEPEHLPDAVVPAWLEGNQPTQPKPSRHGKAGSTRKVKPSAAAKPAETKPAGTKPAGTKPATKPVRPFPSQQNGSKTPPLPRPKPPSFSSHRHAVNPNLAIGLLKEVETVVVGWQLALEQTVLEIQAVYIEGPIVDGWLESHPSGSPQVTQPIGAATLRHAEIDRLMDYVEEICRTPYSTEPNETSRTGYRLCGLDADGQLWSRPCPSQQVPYVSLAIARYQKLRILFAKKQSLENRLNQLIQSLTLLHGQLQDPL
jgi:hypothetical protein